jgi:hypothetical protein
MPAHTYIQSMVLTVLTLSTSGGYTIDSLLVRMTSHRCVDGSAHNPGSYLPTTATRNRICRRLELLPTRVAADSSVWHNTRSIHGVAAPAMSRVCCLATTTTSRENLSFQSQWFENEKPRTGRQASSSSTALVTARVHACDPDDRVVHPMVGEVPTDSNSCNSQTQQ